MKNSFYLRMALSNLQKNRRFFFPRILTEAGLLGSFFIVLTLARDSRLSAIRGGAYIPTFMAMGAVVLLILSVVLMFYTNSFLMKQRKKEFGLYNILGMEKRHVGRVLFHESLICSLVSMVLGLIFGVLFYKVCSLLICRLLRSEIVLGFYFIRVDTLLYPAVIFLAVDLVIFLFNRISIARMKPVELLVSDYAGEREPKVRRILLIVGVIALGAGYYISLTTKSPLKAIGLFFIAVLLVILGTYCLYVAGSIFVLKMLKRNERYYYQKQHMPAVSGMLYRMKQNAVGLASITILATCVLVMISTTFSLYRGVTETLEQNYPQHQYYSAQWDKNGAESVRVPGELIGQWIREIAADHDLEIVEIEEQEFFEAAFLYEGGVLIGDRNSGELKEDMSNLAEFIFMSREAYEKMSGNSLSLGENEIAVCPLTADSEDDADSLIIGDRTFRIVQVLDRYPVSSALMSLTRGYGVVLPDEEALRRFYEYQKNAYGKNASEMISRVAVTYAEPWEACVVGEELSDELRARLEVYLQQQEGFTGAWGSSSDTLWETRDYVYGLYGSLLFLGMLLGLVFLFATGLIIYYKQISEGYEDRSRFRIMEKIGMSRAEVRAAIRSQILMVFFLPVVFAGIHVAFAFPILVKLLRVMLLSSVWLFVGCTAAVFAAFILIYTLIYLGTARTYYKIVQ